METTTFKKGDKVIYSPHIGCDEKWKQVCTLRTEPQEINGELVAWFEEKAGYFCLSHCEPISTNN